MSTTTTERYREKMNDIRLLLNLLRIEASRAEEYMLQAGADKDDVRALKNHQAARQGLRRVRGERGSHDRRGAAHGEGFGKQRRMRN